MISIGAHILSLMGGRYPDLTVDQLIAFLREVVRTSCVEFKRAERRTVAVYGFQLGPGNDLKELVMLMGVLSGTFARLQRHLPHYDAIVFKNLISTNAWHNPLPVIYAT